ncbi:16S rRNA (guanine(966)-N(2))-methyltransferase RsmD [Gangjinia marincola]|uniref:16S rRNA (Guanine(966)-N(2))-methyltransferase RsmD n=1 Tax=Gangjinia marincola TaxID=578463 RepID=A0ABP3XP36_9FLAO
MRIISGKHKGRRLIAPKKLPVRPTTDMAKEALFNIVGNLYDLEEVSVLDLFSGTGNIAYEFASRGTLQLTAVDQNVHCIRFIQQNSKALSLDIKTIKADVFKFLTQIRTSHDLIFADPPYDLSQADFQKIIDLVFEYNLLKEGGILVIEHSKHMVLSENQNFESSRTYGSSTFSFFEQASAITPN